MNEANVLAVANALGRAQPVSAANVLAEASKQSSKNKEALSSMETIAPCPPPGFCGLRVFGLQKLISQLTGNQLVLIQKFPTINFGA